VTTYAATIESIMTKVAGGARAMVNFVRGDLDATETQVPLVMRAHASLSTGAIIEMGTELAYVMEIETTSKVATVVRGWAGTVPVAHPDGTVVRLNPRFTRREATEEFWVECSASFPNIGRPATVAVPVSPGQRVAAVTVPSAVVGDTLACRYGDGRSVRGVVRPITTFDDAGSATAGAQLVLNEAAAGSGTLVVTLLVPYDAGVTPETVAPSADLETVLGASRSGLNALVLGTVFRLMQTRSVQRTDLANQNESRLGEEVTVGDLATITDRLRQVRDRARAEAAQQLHAVYPWRMRS
jgi:hypothetical protein